MAEHTDPQKLAYEFAGKGTPFREKPGTAGYQEIVNFDEIIGYVVDRDSGQKMATTWGENSLC